MKCGKFWANKALTDAEINDVHSQGSDCVCEWKSIRASVPDSWCKVICEYDSTAPACVSVYNGEDNLAHQTCTWSCGVCGWKSIRESVTD